MLYHLVCPTKFRRIVINQKIESLLKDTCLQIALRYDMNFVEIGTDKDHVHFLIQSVPMMRALKSFKSLKVLLPENSFLISPL